MSENEQHVAAPIAKAESEPKAIIDVSSTVENKKITEEESLGFLKEMQENVGQMSELAKEEENLVKEFFNFLLKIMKPFSKTLEISVGSLPEAYDGRISRAYLYFTGQLVLVYKNGEVEILNLSDQENHEVLIEISGEIMMKLKTIITSYKSKAEKRVKFLMTVTKELQKVAKVFSEE
jgi:hypothetical protein